MARRIPLLLICALSCALAYSQDHYSGELSAEKIALVVNDAIGWQKDNMPTFGRAVYNPRYTGWADGAFLSAVAEWTSVDDSRGYRAWLKDVAEQVSYQPGPRSLNPANDIGVCMLYANLYNENPQKEYLIDTITDFGRQLETLRGGWKTISPTIERLDYIIKYYPQMDDDLDFYLSRNQVRWCWCDALYMAAPTFAAFADITGNDDYREFMNREFWRTIRNLYDPEERLIFRDTRYKTIKSDNGAKMFWGRGNGWTVGAIVRVLGNLPGDYPDRPKYERLLREMMSRIVQLQDSDGYWNTSLLDREFYPNPETSATGFFTYALWWGINNGVLDEKTYLPYAQKGWEAMVRAVHPGGMLGRVQAIGDAPANITPDKNEVYGTAALILSGLEALKYSGGIKVMARAVPERADDFVFENDLIAGRFYGKALEGDPTSPGLDIWVKLPGDLVADKWYAEALRDGSYYHHDHGGKDCYKVAVSLGGGASVPYSGGKLQWPATNYRSCEVLEKSPDKVVFALHYPAWTIDDGISVSLDKKVTVRAGSYFIQVEDTYNFSGAETLTIAAGIKLHGDQKTVKRQLKKKDRFAIWEKASDQSVESEDGMIGVAILMKGADDMVVSRKLDHGLLLKRISSGQTVSYSVGSCWSKGEIKDASEWFRLVNIETSCREEPLEKMISRSLELSEKQTLLLASSLEGIDGALPKSFENGELRTASYSDWISGFFPGVLWMLSEVSANPRLKSYAELYTSRVEPAKKLTSTHDLGFMLMSSFGQGYRLTGNPHYLEVILEGTDSLMTRWNPDLGVMKSWNSNKRWKYPVIIDNMMNLEMLCFVSGTRGDQFFKDAAVAHAKTTLKNHFRDDFSSWHVVSYDPETLSPHAKNTAQGYSDDSAWARGQAWGLYGYTMMYRLTGIEAFLQQARNIALFIIRHPNLPEDKIPYWDFNAPDIPDAPRDASAGAIMASALIELSQLDPSKDSKLWLSTAKTQLRSLSSEAYQAAEGEQGGFILKHSVGSLPGKSEVDVPLTYADYYYLEALLRLRALL